VIPSKNRRGITAAAECFPPDDLQTLTDLAGCAIHQQFETYQHTPSKIP
jgi:hypothetical protein